MDALERDCECPYCLSEMWTSHGHDETCVAKFKEALESGPAISYIYGKLKKAGAEGDDLDVIMRRVYYEAYHGDGRCDGATEVANGVRELFTWSRTRLGSTYWSAIAQREEAVDD